MVKVKKNNDLLSGIIFFIVAGVYFISAFQIKQFPDGFISSDFIPKILGAVLMILSVLQIISSIKGKKGRTIQQKDKKPKKEVFITLILLIVYIAFLKPVGFPVMTTVYIFFQSLLFTPKEKRKPVFAAILSIVFSVTVYLIFVRCFTLTLPAGILG